MRLTAMLGNKTKPDAGGQHEQSPVANLGQPQRQKFPRLNFACGLCSIANHQSRPSGVFCGDVGHLHRSAQAFFQSNFAVKPTRGVAACEALGQAEQQTSQRESQADDARPKQCRLWNGSQFVNAQGGKPQTNANQQPKPHVLPAPLQLAASCSGGNFRVNDLFFPHAKSQCCAPTALFTSAKRWFSL